jgi:hypothetical protein
MNHVKKENGCSEIQNMVDTPHHEGLSDRYDELGEKEECPLADEILDLEQKIESIKNNSEINKSEFLEIRTTGVDSLIEKDKKQEVKSIDLKEKEKEKELKIKLTPLEKALCSFDNQGESKDLNSGSSPNQPKKSKNGNIIFIPEEESKYISESILVGKKTKRENDLQEENNTSEEEKFNDFGYLEDLFNNMNNGEGEVDERLDEHFNFSEINCNIIRYNSNYSPHIEDIEDESEFLARNQVSFGTYLQTCYSNSTSPGTSSKTNE